MVNHLIILKWGVLLFVGGRKKNPNFTSQDFHTRRGPFDLESQICTVSPINLSVTPKLSFFSDLLKSIFFFLIFQKKMFTICAIAFKLIGLLD